LSNHDSSRPFGRNEVSTPIVWTLWVFSLPHTVAVVDLEEIEDIRVYYTIEQPGAPWGKAP